MISKVIMVVIAFVAGTVMSLFSIDNEANVLSDGAIEQGVRIDYHLRLCFSDVESTTRINVKKEYSALGGVYRTDTIKGDAVSDVGVCAEVSRYQRKMTDQGVTVTLAPESIIFDRPRINVFATSLDYNNGADLAEAASLGLVAESTEMYQLGYAYGELMATEGPCMDQAWEVVAEAIKKGVAEHEAMIAKSNGETPPVVNVVLDADAALEAAHAQLDEAMRNSPHERARENYALLADDPNIKKSAGNSEVSCEITRDF